MKVWCSFDPLELERLIVRRVEERPQAGLVDPILIVVPTQRLVRRLKTVLAHRLGATLGVHVFTHRGFALRCLENALEVPPRVVPRALLEKLIEALAAGEREREAEYLRRYGGVRSAILKTIEELREARVLPKELRRSHLIRQGMRSLLPRLYERYTKAIGVLQRSGLTDRAGAVEAAFPHVETFLRRKRFRKAIHYGAYELTAVHFELLLRIAEAVDTEVFVPAEPDAPAAAYARPFFEALRAHGATIEVTQSDGASRRAEWMAAIRSLYAGWGARPQSRPPIEFEAQSSQGPEAELEAAALRALAIHNRDGVPLEEIAIVARSLQPYQPFLESTFAKLRIPYSTSAAVPLARDPAVSAFLALLEVLAADFPRGRTVDLLSRPFLRVPLDPAALDFADLRDAARWDRWSREARIVSGIASWRELARWVDRPPDIDDIEEPDEAAAKRSSQEAKRSVEELLGALEALDAERARWGTLRTFEEHAAFLGELARKYIRTEGPPLARSGGTRPAAPGSYAEGGGQTREAPQKKETAHGAHDGGGLEGIERILRGIRHAGLVAHAAEAALAASPRDRPGRRGESSRERVADGLPGEPGRSSAPSMDEVARLARSLAESEEIPPAGAGDVGVGVFDAMQARSIPHRVVIWIGFHDGSFPQRPRADVHLPDPAREALAGELGRFVFPKARGVEEERLLLAVTLASATDRIAISFQRADEEGRRIARSSALREVARVFTGRPDAQAILKGSGSWASAYERISAHPVERAQRLAASEKFGLLPASDALMAQAADVRSSLEAAKALAKELFPGDSVRLAALDCVAALEEFGPKLSPFDAQVSKGFSVAKPLSPTALERLCRCPLAFFLRYILGLRELEDEAVPHRVELRVFGSAVHKTLAEVYRMLISNGLLSGGQPDPEAAFEILGATWRARLERALGPAASRLRALFDAIGDRWLEKLKDFVKQDLDELRERGAKSIETEKRFEAKLTLGERLKVRIAGRADRVVILEEGLLVDDYKTHGKIKRKAEPARILRGLEIQLPLYREALSASLRVEPSKIYARYLGVGPQVDSETAELPEKEPEKLRAGLLDTLREALKIARSGFYPLFPSNGQQTNYCRYCGYRKTCRRTHEPTVHRLGLQKAFQILERLRRKDTRGHYLLSDVPEAVEEGNAGGDE